MSITTFVLDESGTRKSTSLRNLNLESFFLIQIRQNHCRLNPKTGDKLSVRIMIHGMTGIFLLVATLPKLYGFCVSYLIT